MVDVSKDNYDDDLQVNFRIKSSLKKRVEASAKANNRSTTAELSWLINAALDGGTGGEIQAIRSVFTKEFEQFLDYLKVKIDGHQL